MSYTSKTGKEYITGVQRSKPYPESLSTHLYDGDFTNPGLPMCEKGWTEMPFERAYSIWRNNVSRKGLCKTCQKRADQGLDGVEAVGYEVEE